MFPDNEVDAYVRERGGCGCVSNCFTQESAPIDLLTPGLW